MSLALNFPGGPPFQLLYDGVKEAISATRKFRTQLINLEFTLDCLQPQIIQQIRNNNVQLSLPDDIIQDLQVKMNEGIDLVARLSQLSMWNIRIWGNCCNCIKPNYAEQLEDLDRSLKRLLELLKLEQTRNITLLMLRIDEIEKRQSDILQALQDIPGHISRAQQEVIQRMQVNVAQQASNGEGGAAAPAPVLGVVFGMLYDAVTQVKVKNLMFNRLLGEIKYSLDCLKPLIEEVANNNKVLHLPMLELEDFAKEMEKAVEFVHKCSKVSKLANYRKYPWTNKLLKLDKYLQKLFTDFKGQVEGKVKEAMELVSNIEAVMNQTKGSVVENDDIESEGRNLLPQPLSPSVRLEVQNVLGTSTHVIKKTLIDTATITEEVDSAKILIDQKGVKSNERSDVVQDQMETAAGLDVLSLQGSMDVQVEIEAVEHSTDSKGGGVEQIVDLKGKGHSSPVEHSTDSNIELVDSALKHARNIDSETEMFMQVPLPEEIIGNIISLTTPADVCRLSLVSRRFKNAAKSDQVWVNFLPSLIHTIQSQSTSSSTFVAAKSKKEIYLALCDNSVLMDNGKMSFSLDKWSGKKCYMICARELFIVWAQDKSRYWSWISLADSRFKEVASLDKVCWLEIRGKIDMSILSPWTLYKAYLVYKLTERHYGFNVPVEVAVCERHYGFEYGELDHALGGAENKQTVYLDPSLEILDGARRPNERADGWLEMELGEFLCQAEEDGEMEMICGEYKNLCWKSGLIVQGIEVRPERKEYTPTPKAMQEDHISEPKAKNQ